jgi:DNA-binding HxlR family transcriptional regulator
MTRLLKTRPASPTACAARLSLSEKRIFSDTCSVPRVLDRIGSKWAILVIYALSQGTKRYSELQRLIEGVSPKMLVQNLRNLEGCGLVQREIFPVVPPQVEYSLTALGETLVEPLAMLYVWSEKNVDAMRATHAKVGAMASVIPTPQKRTIADELAQSRAPVRKTTR